LYASARPLLILLTCLALAGLMIYNVNAQTTYAVTVTIQGLPSNLSTRVYVDGALNGTMNGGASRSFNFSTSNNPHVIIVDFYVPSSTNGTRYYEKNFQWSFSAAGNHAFTYTAQYYLAIQTTYSSADGQGWYDSGASAPATVRDREIDEGQGTRHVFAGWAGDASGTQLTSNDIFMNGPKVAIANWKTQFFLTVESDPPNVSSLSGSGWYDAGSQADFSAAPTVAANENTRLKFNHWSGEYTGQLPTGRVLMDRPKTVKANYLAQYLLTVQYDPASITSSYNETHAGWYDANTNIQLGPAPSTIDLSSVERLRFAGWIDSGSLSSSLSYTVLVDRPRTVTLSYKTQYYVDIRSSYGSVSGSGWYDRGSSAKIVAPSSSGTWPVSYTLSGWSVDPPTGKLTKADDSWVLIVDRPYVVEAQWSVDYLPLIAIFGGGAILVAALGVGAVVAYRRGIFTRGGPIGRPPKQRPSPLRAGATRVCTSCGNRVPKGAAFCEKCGAPVQAPKPSSSDDKVYDYIVKHEGVISLSKASEDLGISVDELKEITERLKKQGRLA